MDRIGVAFDNLFSLLQSNDWDSTRTMTEPQIICLNHRFKDIQLKFSNYGTNQFDYCHMRINRLPTIIQFSEEQEKQIEIEAMRLLYRLWDNNGPIAEDQLQTLLN